MRSDTFRIKSKKDEHYPLLLILLYIMAGLTGNVIVSSRFNSSEYPVVQVTLLVTKSLVAIGVVASLVVSVARHKWTLTEWGFSLDRRILVSLTFIALGTILNLMDTRMPRGVQYEDAWLFPYVGYSTVEELVFRVILISQLVKLFSSVRFAALWAILISSLAFTVVHMPIKSYFQLQDLFVNSILFGTIYCVTGSVLVPMYFHVLGNTQQVSGYLGAIVSLGLYFSLAVWGKVMEKRSRAVVG